MGGSAAGPDLVAPDASAAGDAAAVGAGGLGHQNVGGGRALRLDQRAGGGGADLLVRGGEQPDRAGAVGRGGEGARGLQRRDLAAGAFGEVAAQAVAHHVAHPKRSLFAALAGKGAGVSRARWLPSRVRRCPVLFASLAQSLPLAPSPSALGGDGALLYASSASCGNLHHATVCNFYPLGWQHDHAAA